jgi:hypothetical protein
VLVTFHSQDAFNQGFYSVKFAVKGKDVDLATGLLPVQLSNADGSNPQPKFESLCVDPVHQLPNGTVSYLATPTPANTGLPQNGGEISYLNSHHGFFLQSGFAYTTPDGFYAGPSKHPLAKAVGLQLAIWELEYNLTDAAFTPDTRFTTQAQLNNAKRYADGFVAEAQGQNENAVFLDATLGGTVAHPTGQGLISPTPTVTTQPAGTVVLGSGAKLTDSATLSGGLNPTGTVTFTLTLNGKPVDTETAAVNGDGTYSTPGGHLPTAVGTYQWVASYGGNAFNFPVSSNLGDEPEVVSPAGPAITTTPSVTSVTLGTSSVTLKDSAVLSGGSSPTGTITFTLFFNGGAAPVDTETVPVSGNGSYATPTGFTLPAAAAAAGTYQWDATYSGDSNDKAASDTGAANERVLVSPASPTITTTPGGTVTVGTGVPLTDSATLAGGFNPTGTITFQLVAPAALGGGVVDTEAVTVNGDGTYSTPTGFVPTAAGTYQWVATYSGDANNNGVASPLGSEPEVASQEGTSGARVISKRVFIASNLDPTHGETRKPDDHVRKHHKGKARVHR